MGLEGEGYWRSSGGFSSSDPYPGCNGKGWEVRPGHAGFLTQPAGMDVMGGLPKESDIWSKTRMMGKS